MRNYYYQILLFLRIQAPLYCYCLQSCRSRRVSPTLMLNSFFYTNNNNGRINLTPSRAAIDTPSRRGALIPNLETWTERLPTGDGLAFQHQVLRCWCAPSSVRSVRKLPKSRSDHLSVQAYTRSVARLKAHHGANGLVLARDRDLISGHLG